MIRTSIFIVSALLAGWHFEASAQNTAVAWSSFDMGFGVPSGSNTAVKSTLGEPLVGATGGTGTGLIDGASGGQTISNGPVG